MAVKSRCAQSQVSKSRPTGAYGSRSSERKIKQNIAKQKLCCFPAFQFPWIAPIVSIDPGLRVGFRTSDSPKPVTYPLHLTPQNAPLSPTSLEIFTLPMHYFFLLPNVLCFHPLSPPFLGLQGSFYPFHQRNTPFWAGDGIPTIFSFWAVLLALFLHFIRRTLVLSNM